MSATGELVTRPSAALSAGGLDREQLELLKRTICTDATDDEYLMFVGICKRTGLDPFAKQIYFRKYKGYNGKPDRVTVITGIDGYRLMAQRSGEYEGQTEPEWCGADGVWKKVWTESKPPYAARVGVWRKNFREPAVAIAKWSEYYPTNEKERFIWDKMPANQIAKCAEALSLRKAFPHELSGIYTQEEMAQAGPEYTPLPVKEGSAPKADTGATAANGLGTGKNVGTPSESTPATTQTTPSGGTGSKQRPRAPSIKHDGTFASHKQVAYLHLLKHKAGVPDCKPDECGIEVEEEKKWGKKTKRVQRCVYHAQLAAFKDCDGKPITTSTNLSEGQISSLIDRYEEKIRVQEQRAEEQPDLDAAFSQAEENARIRGELGPGADG